MTDYLTTDTELTSIADAIRAKGSTISRLMYPAGFVSAINAIPTGGGDEYPITNASGDPVDLFINNSGNIDITTLDNYDNYPYQAGAIAVVYSSYGELYLNDGDIPTITPDGQTVIFVMPDYDVTLNIS